MFNAKTFISAIFLTFLLAFGVSATTVSFDVEVTESRLDLPPVPFPPSATLPALGTIGTVTISLPGIDATDATPFLDPDNPPNAGSVEASISIGGLTASLEVGAGAIAFVNDTIVRFANGSFSSILANFPRDASATPTYAGSFVVETPADGATPQTFGDVVAAITDPSASLFFSFNGTTFAGIDTFFRADSVAPVPVPASALLLVSALFGTAYLRRRKSV